MKHFTNNIRRILNRSNKGEKLTNMKKTLTILITIGMMTAIALAQSEFREVNQPDQQAKAKTIVGTWLLTITPDEPGAPSFQGLYTFTGDGIALLSSVGPPIPGLGNPGQGIWEKTGANTFVATFKQFTFDDIFTTNGSLVVKSTITLTGADTFTSQDIVKIYDLSENLVFTGGGIQQARRMKIE